MRIVMIASLIHIDIDGYDACISGILAPPVAGALAGTGSAFLVCPDGSFAAVVMHVLNFRGRDPVLSFLLTAQSLATSWSSECFDRWGRGRRIDELPKWRHTQSLYFINFKSVYDSLKCTRFVVPSHSDSHRFITLSKAFLR
ncbi:hypothetical protein F2Q68_00029776 [Brassica cretica]|uniref:Uncharacterized protein n=1 Tax=Brassica cretica TaxID=69181 RepID=A0A8S9GGB0_BRACR|nr:hypothetical protein F2Q68_00029776 [Brassica cretica]